MSLRLDDWVERKYFDRNIYSEGYFESIQIQPCVRDLPRVFLEVKETLEFSETEK